MVQSMRRRSARRLNAAAESDGRPVLTLRLVRQHVAYDNEDRPHLSLRGDAPIARPVEPPNAGDVVALRRRARRRRQSTTQAPDKS
jgi:hypothetical protein